MWTTFWLIPVTFFPCHAMATNLTREDVNNLWREICHFVASNIHGDEFEEIWAECMEKWNKVMEEQEMETWSVILSDCAEYLRGAGDGIRGSVAMEIICLLNVNLPGQGSSTDSD